MTLTTKKSRPITIDGAKYRYQVSTTKISEDFNYSLNLTVQRAEPAGSVLQVKGLIFRDFWLDISDGEKWNKNDYPTILPKNISIITKKAIKNGWEPDKPGKPYNLETTNEIFFNSKI